MDCVKNCEFIVFEDDEFQCSYYNEPLSFVGNPPKITLQKCLKCENDGIIGIDETTEDARKLKKYIGWLADSFYSHKDEFESNLTEIYRILKNMEER